MKTKHDFTIYRENSLIAKNVEQRLAHKLVRQDALEQFAKGFTPAYVIKGTFADGKMDTKIAVFHRIKRRLYWKFIKPC